jgi:putative tryptophan/tyrosine transport system substrate-binding protein
LKTGVVLNLTAEGYVRRRDFIKVIAVLTAAWPLPARAQQPTKTVPRVGWLVTGSPTSYRFSLGAFRNGLKALGYIEGQNIKIDYRWAEGNVDRLRELANDLVEQKVDIILAGGTVGAKAARHATSLIPIIAAGAGDLVELGVVTSLAAPGGNLTGFVATAPETAAKRFEIMKELKPKARRAAVLRNPTDPNAKVEWQIAKEFATANDIALDIHEAHDIEQLNNALARVPQFDPDVLVVLNDPFMFTSRKTIADAANRLRLPAIFGFREFVDDGGLISYGASVSDTYRRAADYVDKVLKGAKPANLPVQLPTKFELVINLKTAKALGLDVPQSLIDRADEMIE